MIDTDFLTDPLELEADAPAPVALLARAAPAWADLELVDLAGFLTVSQREAGPWICCAPCSAAMVGAWAGKCSPTLAAAHRIRTAAGYAHAGGTSPGRIAAASGFAFERLEVDRRAIDDRLASGWGLFVAIAADRLTAGLKRYIPGFDGGHAVALAGRAYDGRWGYWDPAAPTGALGVYADPADVMAAVWTGAGSIHALEGPTMTPAQITDMTARTVTVAKGATIYELDNRTKVRTLTVALPARVSPFGVGSRRAIYLTSPGVAGGRLGLVAATIVPTPPAPAPDLVALEAARVAGASAEYDRWRAALVGLTPPL